MSESQCRVALVTGGSRGIGAAVVESLAERGYRVFFCGAGVHSVEAALERFGKRWGERIAGEVVDVRDEAAVSQYVASVEARAGGIEVLVNNAGLGRFAPVDELSGETFRLVVETNLLGAFYFLHAVAPGMKQRGSGWIVNIGSLASKNPFAGGAAYNASKFGLLGMSEAAMLDLRPYGVRVAAVLPGSVDTEFRPETGADNSWMLAPEDVARAVTDLLAYPDRALPSLIELRPSRPQRRG